MKDLFAPSLVGSIDFSGQNVEFVLMLFKGNHLKERGGYQQSHSLPSYAARLHKQNDLMEKAITHSRCTDNCFFISLTSVYYIRKVITSKVIQNQRHSTDKTRK